MITVEVDISADVLERVNVWLNSQLRRVLTEAGSASYDAGTIAKLLSDIEAMKSLKALKPSIFKPVEPFRSDADKLADQQLAANNHKKTEARRLEGDRAR